MTVEDPTGALPLNIKALEATTTERKLERRSSLARRPYYGSVPTTTEEDRMDRRRLFTAGGAAALAAAAGKSALADGGNQGIVGSYFGTVTAVNPPLGSFNDVISFHEGGVVTESRAHPVGQLAVDGPPLQCLIVHHENAIQGELALGGQKGLLKAQFIVGPLAGCDVAFNGQEPHNRVRLVPDGTQRRFNIDEPTIFGAIDERALHGFSLQELDPQVLVVS